MSGRATIARRNKGVSKSLRATIAGGVIGVVAMSDVVVGESRERCHHGSDGCNGLGKRGSPQFVRMARAENALGRDAAAWVPLVIVRR